VGAWVCFDELQYADSFGVLDLYNFGCLRLGTLRSYSYLLGEKCLGGSLNEMSEKHFREYREYGWVILYVKKKEKRELGRFGSAVTFRL
jgi:hypothetical protein